MNEQQSQTKAMSANTSEKDAKPKYETPQIKLMTEQEVLSAFQVTAAGTSMWWT